VAPGGNGSSTGENVNKKTVKVIFIKKGSKVSVSTATVEVEKDKNFVLVKDIESKVKKGYRLLKGTDRATINAKGEAEVLVEAIPSRGGHSGYAIQRVRISFIDQDGDEVGYKQLNGKDTFTSKIEAPAGYTLVNSSNATIKFNKKGNKDIKVKV